MEIMEEGESILASSTDEDTSDEDTVDDVDFVPGSMTALTWKSNQRRRERGRGEGE